MTLQTIRPNKGDFVPGHKAVAFFADPELPAVHGRIAAASDSGHCVTFEVHAVLAAFGLPRRSCWTWRRSVAAYQQKGAPTRKGEGLALLRSR